ncbi:helix-turn-helix domain-containing protein [Catenulispora sp. NL8]|uniref:Helix-turn-helix domain-containing protein n=1 Tax=Catenulispora pinistramenti TaxID=2705254 RepID=A0ABS5L6W2_9ACTN|nr:helix-turn-helix domain-containing protein [Catenulispora pinistramenti]MBS2554082.1 helix-turn-helix domain-containing protein [Catenulispora pinistramenti]
MANERLRATMTARGMTAEKLAAAIGIDPKTVERWVNTGRVPYARLAVPAAEALQEDAMFLWPNLHQGRSARALSPELVAIYGQRAEMAPAVWFSFFEQAEQAIDVLVYAANHLQESVPGFNDLLADKAARGCAVRIALGDPDSPNIIARGQEEKFGHGIESRCRLALMHYRPLLGKRNIEIRTHGTTLYNSIYRSDDELLINGHVWGVNAFGAPVWHLRRGKSGTMVNTYRDSFDAVWERAAPVA